MDGFSSKYFVTIKNFFLKFFNFVKERIKEMVVCIKLRYLKKFLPSKPCAILYLFKYNIAIPTPLNKFAQNIITNQKRFWKLKIFQG